MERLPAFSAGREPPLSEGEAGVKATEYTQNSLGGIAPNDKAAVPGSHSLQHDSPYHGLCGEPDSLEWTIQSHPRRRQTEAVKTP